MFHVESRVQLLLEERFLAREHVGSTQPFLFNLTEGLHKPILHESSKNLLSDNGIQTIVWKER